MTSFENVREIRGKMKQNGNLKSGERAINEKIHETRGRCDAC